MANKAENIYIDSNVLINYCTGRGVGRDGLSYLFSKVKKRSFIYFVTRYCANNSTASKGRL